MAEELTLKQKRFVDAYLGQANGNATKAAKLAGYEVEDPATLRTIGAQNLAKPNIRSEIERRYRENCLSADEVLSRLADQARGVGPYLVEDSDAPGGVKLDIKALLEDGKGHLIRKINKDGEIDVYDAQAAQGQLGRYLKLFTDKLDISGIDKLIEQELARMASGGEAGPAGTSAED